MQRDVAYGRASMHRWASLRTELLWLYDGPVAQESQHVESDHRLGYWVWLIRRGEVKVQVRDKQWIARAGQWMISPQGVAKQHFSEDATILSIHFQCQWPTGENLFSDPQAAVFDAKDYPQLEKSGAALCRMVHRHFPGVRLEYSVSAVEYTVFLRFQRLFLQWLSDFHDVWSTRGRSLAQAGDGDERLLRAVKCLNETPLSDDFPASRLHLETGLGRAHLDRLFWKDYGVTTREYWEKLREELAMRSLQSESLSIKEIGYRLGFKQASHFTKWFRRRSGSTPKAYRERGSKAWVSQASLIGSS